MRYPIPADLRRLLERHGAVVTGTREIQAATQYELARDADKATLNVYSTEKVLEGGKASALRDLLRDWRVARQGSGSKAKPAANGTAAPGASGWPVPNAAPRVGTDEAGKGEYLGPLVVAGVRIIGAKKDLEMREIGVRDSKLLGPGSARRMAEEVGRVAGPENVRVVCLTPTEYEERRDAAGKNVNRLLAEVNASIINELKSDVEVAVVDSFGVKAGEYLEPLVPRGVRLEVRPRAEDDAAVAAASIMARARYLEEMDRLSERVGFRLPLGSTHVEEGVRRVYEGLGPEGLREVAKVHFATTEKLFGAGWERGGGR